MMIRKECRTDRRGVSMVEAAVVYPVTMLLLIGTLVLGIAVFRYQQLQALAREGARYASVHGPTYASEQLGNSTLYATTAEVSNQIESLAVGMQTSDLSCSVTWNPNPPTASPPSTVTVRITYAWIPEAYFSKQTVNLTASSTMPVVY
jgi:Flp pilus assembly protein TadG